MKFMRFHLMPYTELPDDWGSGWGSHGVPLPEGKAIGSGGRYAPHIQTAWLGWIRSQRLPYRSRNTATTP
jgi:hypothetical protein